MIKAVSFDAAGTLIQLAEEVGTSYSRVAASFGVASNGEEVEVEGPRAPPQRAAAQVTALRGLHTLHSPEELQWGDTSGRTKLQGEGGRGVPSGRRAGGGAASPPAQQR